MSEKSIIYELVALIFQDGRISRVALSEAREHRVGEGECGKMERSRTARHAPINRRIRGISIEGLVTLYQ